VPVITASTTRNAVARPMRPRARRAPARTHPRASAACSSARTTVVPIAMTRPPLDLASSIAAAVRLGIR